MNLMEALSQPTWALLQTLQRFARIHGTNPEEDRAMGPLVAMVRQRLGDLPTTEAEWREALLDLLADTIVAGWDRYGAPSVARHPEKEGVWVGSFDSPGGPYAVEAPSKREAYRLARREWIRRILTR